MYKSFLCITSQGQYKQHFLCLYCFRWGNNICRCIIGWKLHHLKNLKRSKQSQIVRFANKQECQNTSWLRYRWNNKPYWGANNNLRNCSIKRGRFATNFYQKTGPSWSKVTSFGPCWSNFFSPLWRDVLLAALFISVSICNCILYLSC